MFVRIAVILSIVFIGLGSQAALADNDSKLKKESLDRIEHLNKKAKEIDEQMRRDRIKQQQIELRRKQLRDLRAMPKDKLVDMVIQLKDARPGPEYNNIYKDKNALLQREIGELTGKIDLLTAELEQAKETDVTNDSGSGKAMAELQQKLINIQTEHKALQAELAIAKKNSNTADAKLAKAISQLTNAQTIIAKLELDAKRLGEARSAALVELNNVKKELERRKSKPVSANAGGGATAALAAAGTDAANTAAGEESSSSGALMFAIGLVLFVVLAAGIVFLMIKVFGNSSQAIGEKPVGESSRFAFEKDMSTP